MKKTFFAAMLFGALLFSKTSLAHCEVPCGIYNDELRIALLYEHITTIEKAMTQMTELSGEEKINYNQLIRWTVTKEDHAKEIQHVVTQYFITQRVKLPASTEGEEYDRYQKQLASLHELIVYAMKTKQTTDLSYIEKLRTSLASFEAVYFEGKHRHKVEEAH